MSFSKSIRKKRRHSRKRNMRGGGLPTSMAILSYNTSFVLSKNRLFPAEASENTSIYLRLMKLKSLMNNTDSEQDFIANHYQKLFSMSCKIIEAFFLEHKEYEYRVAALQEMNPTNHYLSIMQQNFALEELTILASAVSINGGTGLAYVIPSNTLDQFLNKLEYEIPTDIQQLEETKPEDYTKWFKSRNNKEWFLSDPVHNDFTSQKVAIVDLGDHPIYVSTNFQKARPDGSPLGPDIGRPMALIVRNESDGYTLHFNCHIPNPSALKIPPTYTQSILEKHSTDDSSYMNKWAEITHEIINEEARGLLLRFFSLEQLSTLTPDNCRIIFSGDFNDGSGMLMDLMETLGLTVADSGLTNIRISFGNMPKSCCSNFNSVTRSGIKTSPPSLKLVGIESQRTNSDLKTDQLLVDLLKSTDPNSTDPNLSQYDDIVDVTNYAFVGDGTGSNIPLTSEIYDPLIVSGIPTIDYQTLKSSHIRASDHMPVVSATIDHGRPKPGALEPKRQRSVKEPELVGDTEQLEVSGGYRKKRRSQRKLKQRKSKRHTKKRNYRKNKK